MGSGSASCRDNIPLDYYKENRILQWQVDISRIEGWMHDLDEETKVQVVAAIRFG